MPRKPVVTKRASYRDGVHWIAANDNPGEDNPIHDGRDGEKQQATRDRIAGYVSTLLLADLFGADPDVVASDIYRKRVEIARLGGW